MKKTNGDANSVITVPDALKTFRQTYNLNKILRKSTVTQHQDSNFQVTEIK